jgi:signal transduction histidine kinase
MPNGGILTVSTLWGPSLGGGLDGMGLEISISDTGAGMTPEQINNAFDPFFTTKEMGTGLGLPLSQTIIETHGGSIEILSRMGRGTRITISLPRYSPLEQNESEYG